MQENLQAMFKAMFKDAKLNFSIKEKKDNCQDFTMDVYCPSSTQNAVGVFTRISSDHTELKNCCLALLSAIEKETGEKPLNGIKTIKSFQIPLTFNEFKEKHKLDWDEFKRLLFVSNTHVWKEKQTVSPLLAFGFENGGFLKVKGKSLSLGTRDIVIDVISPALSEDDIRSGRTKEFFQWQNIMKCALKLSQQFSLSTYPIEEREKIEKNVNSVEHLNAHSKTIFLNLLNKISSPENPFEDLPDSPIKAICEIFKEKHLQPEKKQGLGKDSTKIVSTMKKMK